MLIYYGKWYLQKKIPISFRFSNFMEYRFLTLWFSEFPCCYVLFSVLGFIKFTVLWFLVSLNKGVFIFFLGFSFFIRKLIQHFSDLHNVLTLLKHQLFSYCIFCEHICISPLFLLQGPTQETKYEGSIIDFQCLEQW